MKRATVTLTAKEVAALLHATLAYSFEGDAAHYSALAKLQKAWRATR